MSSSTAPSSSYTAQAQIRYLDFCEVTSPCLSQSSISPFRAIKEGPTCKSFLPISADHGTSIFLFSVVKTSFPLVPHSLNTEAIYLYLFNTKHILYFSNIWWVAGEIKLNQLTHNTDESQVCIFGQGDIPRRHLDDFISMTFRKKAKLLERRH